MRPLSYIKLEYLKDSKEKMAWTLAYGVADCRMWNIKSPGHAYNESTRTLDGLKELGIIPQGRDKAMRALTTPEEYNEAKVFKLSLKANK